MLIIFIAICYASCMLSCKSVNNNYLVIENKIGVTVISAQLLSKCLVMISPWNTENKYTMFDMISGYIEKQCNMICCPINLCGSFQIYIRNGSLKANVSLRQRANLGLNNPSNPT